eukprot:4626137-Heterocapsa_arctica.AAC.1
MPLSESPIEGYHAEIAKICSRCHGGREPYAFAEVRLKTNLQRLQDWIQKPGGLEVVSYEWNRYKRVLNLEFTRSPKVTTKFFTRSFYRLRTETVGPVHTIATSWVHRLSRALEDRSMGMKLKHDFVKHCMSINCYFTLPSVEEGRPLLVILLLKWYTNQERLVDTGDNRDARDTASAQFFRVWSQDPVEGAPRRLTIIPDMEPVDCIPWQCAETWKTFREHALIWQAKPSDIF